MDDRRCNDMMIFLDSVEVVEMTYQVGMAKLAGART